MPEKFGLWIDCWFPSVVGPPLTTFAIIFCFPMVCSATNRQHEPKTIQKTLEKTAVAASSSKPFKTKVSLILYPKICLSFFSKTCKYCVVYVCLHNMYPVPYTCFTSYVYIIPLKHSILGIRKSTRPNVDTKFYCLSCRKKLKDVFNKQWCLT